MNKIKVVRASGMPVQTENYKKFNEEMKELYDKVMAKVGIDMNKPSYITEEQGNRSNKLLTRLNDYLLKKYPAEERWEPIKTTEQWRELVEEHGVIMISKDEGDSITYVIYDLEL